VRDKPSATYVSGKHPCYVRLSTAAGSGELMWVADVPACVLIERYGSDLAVDDEEHRRRLDRHRAAWLSPTSTPMPTAVSPHVMSFAVPPGARVVRAQLTVAHNAELAPAPRYGTCYLEGPAGRAPIIEDGDPLPGARLTCRQAVLTALKGAHGGRWSLVICSGSPKPGAAKRQTALAFVLELWWEAEQPRWHRRLAAWLSQPARGLARWLWGVIALAAATLLAQALRDLLRGHGLGG
jgi:hypothetical protein